MGIAQHAMDYSTAHVDRMGVGRTSTLLRKLAYVDIQHHAIASFPRKRESRAVSGALALGARFRGHDERLGVTYAYFCI